VRPVAALALWALLGAPAAAQWTTTEAQDAGGERSVALARNGDGAEIRIRLDADSRVLASFRLPPGLMRLDPRGCPTFQIDERTPEDLSRERHACTVDGARAQLVLARAEDGSLDSLTLLELMNGSELTVRYRLAHAGYRAARFSLRGSKQALTTTLGELEVASE